MIATLFGGGYLSPILIITAVIIIENTIKMTAEIIERIIALVINPLVK